MEFNNDNELHSNLELLKEKLKNKEKEITMILQSQKEEYERTIKERDEEVTNFVDHLVKENFELKKNIISLQIDMENFKEKFSLGEKTADKIFYDNLKQIKEINESRKKAITDKYDKYNKVLQKEHKQILSNFRKIAYEYKQKNIIYNDYTNNQEDVINEEYLVPLDHIEEQFNLLDSKIRVLNEELNNKEKYLLVVEQKYDMINEENKLLKRLIQEEKTNLLNMIIEIQQESSSTLSEHLAKIRDQMCEKNENLEKEIKQSLEKSDVIVNELLKEKYQFQETIKSLNIELDKLKRELSLQMSEKEELEIILKSRENEMEKIDNIKAKYEREIKQLTIDKEILITANTDLTTKINESSIKLGQLETANKILNDSINREIEKSNQRMRAHIENLDNQIIELNNELREYKTKYEEEKFTGTKNEKNIIELKKDLEINIKYIEQIKSELREKNMNYKVIDNKLEEALASNVKLKLKNSSSEEELTQKEVELKNLKEKLVDNEVEIISLRKDVERITKIKDELLFNLEELKKNYTYINTQFETLKMTNNIETQRLKNQILELEQDKVQKVNHIEHSSNEMKKELKDLKKGISKLYRFYQNKLVLMIGESSQTIINDEKKMLQDIEIDLEKFLLLIKNNISSEKKANELALKYEVEIKELKKKLNTVMEITNSVNSKNNSNPGSNSIQNYNNTFKVAEKENSNSLYETVLIYLKNTNLKHLLEIFKLNMMREEEIRSILNDKTGNNNNNMVNIKKQLSEMNNNYLNLKKLTEQTFFEYQQRAKMYIPQEEIEKIIVEYKEFTHSLLSMVLDTLKNYQINVNEFVVFKFPVNDFDILVENISVNLDKFNNKVNLQIDNYNKTGMLVEKAVDVLIKNTVVDYDVVQSMMQEKLI